MRMQVIEKDHLSIFLRKGRDYSQPLSKLRNYQSAQPGQLCKSTSSQLFAGTQVVGDYEQAKMNQQERVASLVAKSSLAVKDSALIQQKMRDSLYGLNSNKIPTKGSDSF